MIKASAEQDKPILSVSASGYIFRFNFQSLSEVSYSEECRKKKSFSVCLKMVLLFRAVMALLSDR